MRLPEELQIVRSFPIGYSTNPFPPFIMALGKMKTRTEGRVITQVNLQNLIMPSDLHPKGRVELDPTTHMPKMPKRNVLYTDIVKNTGRTREVNGGHALAGGSVWRTALAGPSRYVWKVMRDELNYRTKGKRVITAPDLTEEESVEAREFVTFALAEKALPHDFLSKKYDYDVKTRTMFKEVNDRFYTWKAKQDKEIELSKITEVFRFLPY